MTYHGLEGTRPYRGATDYYADYRPKLSDQFIEHVIERLGWRRDDRILDLGTGPGQIALRLAPYVGEVVGLDIEPDMVAEARPRARKAGLQSVSFLRAGSDDLPSLKPTLGAFRAVMMGETFHWMLDRDRILRDLGDMMGEDGAVLFIRTGIAEEERLVEARKHVRDLLGDYLAAVPPGPHPAGRHDPFPDILTRSEFSRIESIAAEYETEVEPRRRRVVAPRVYRLACSNKARRAARTTGRRSAAPTPRIRGSDGE